MNNHIKGKRLFVLDTNILMHDPTAIFRFQEHDIYLPMVVLEELDSHKTGLSEVARNVRQTNRILIELTNQADHKKMVEGIPLPSHFNQLNQPPCSGRLYFQTDDFKTALPDSLPGTKADNTILGTALALKEKFQDRTITLVSKDINLRIKAGILGIHAEDYFNDKVLDDVNLLHSGTHILPEDFWDKHGRKMNSWQEQGRTYYQLTGPNVSQWSPNDCISTHNDDITIQEGTAAHKIKRPYFDTIFQ